MFGVLFAIVGFLFLISPILPGSKIEDRVDLTMAILSGIFFVFSGIAGIIGAENHPVSNAVKAILFVTVFALFGYSLYDGTSA